MDYKELILSELNKLLRHHRLPPVGGERVYFTPDEAVSREDWTVSRSDILEGDSAGNFLNAAAEGRSWIHADLIPTHDESFLITISVGERVGNPHPSVNVSFEPTHRVRIVGSQFPPTDRAKPQGG